jgi:hypothetical protein
MGIQKLFFCFTALLLGGMSLTAQFDQDPDVLYLKADKVLLLKTLQATPVYANRSFQPQVKTFSQDQELQLLAYHPQALLVKNTSTGYEGWVDPALVTQIERARINQWKAEAEEAKAFAEAIKNEEVLPGMSFENVVQSLGKPTQKSFRSDEKGRRDLWSYVDFERRTEYRQSFDPLSGRVITIPYVVKVAVGSLDVEFHNGRVSAVERTRESGTNTRNHFR